MRVMPHEVDFPENLRTEIERATTRENRRRGPSTKHGQRAHPTQSSAQEESLLVRTLRRAFHDLLYSTFVYTSFNLLLTSYIGGRHLKASLL